MSYSTARALEIFVLTRARAGPLTERKRPHKTETLFRKELLVVIPSQRSELNAAFISHKSHHGAHGERKASFATVVYLFRTFE
jgi:hypothetical protein